MKRKPLRLVIFAFFCQTLVPVQAQTGYPYPYPRTRRSANSRTGGATATNQGLSGTFHGTVKQMTKKEITIVNSDDQEVAIRVSRKTKYWKEGKEIKSSGIEQGMLVSIDAGEDTDMKPIASAVTVESLHKERPGDKPAGDAK